MESFNLVHPV